MIETGDFLLKRYKNSLSNNESAHLYEEIMNEYSISSECWWALAGYGAAFVGLAAITGGFSAFIALSSYGIAVGGLVTSCMYEEV